jgi:bifunctional non-homologous end joining protein LigD
MKPLRSRKCPFADKDTPPRAHWLRPTLVAEIQFQEWTSDGLVRQASFLGLREDKPAREVKLERPRAIGLRGLTHPEKLYWPKDGITKGDLAEYYQRIAPIILPHLKDRPMALRRQPGGIEDKGFFQQSVNQRVPAEVTLVPVQAESGRKLNMVVCQNVETLIYLANIGCLELNPWMSRVGKLDRPDYLVLDLDPMGTKFRKVVETALAIREVLGEMGLEAYCKTSGKRGLHLFIPLGARYEYERVHAFAGELAQTVHRKLPRLTTLEHSVSQRQRRVYLDFLRNARGQTIAAPYSTRPCPGAPVSTPLDWGELEPDLDPREFTLATIRDRIVRVGDLFRGVLGKGVKLP